MAKFIGYIGSYTFRSASKGIGIYDVDTESGRFTLREEVPENNAEYLKVSSDHRFLYAAVDEGISSYRILPDGGLEFLRRSTIRGMRGCHIALHPGGRYIVVSGYYDGKMTVMRITEDGIASEIVAEVFDKGIGSIAERNFAPHISCCKFTRDGRFLCSVDSGIDQVRIYGFNDATGELTLRTILHCEMNSNPCQIMFSPDGSRL